MSLFSKILDKLGLRKEKEQEQPASTGTAGTTGSMPRKPTATAPNPKTTTPAKPAASRPTVGTSSRTTGVAERGVKDDIARQPGGPAAAPKAISEVDVVKQLEQKAKGTGLNWKQSIADLLSLLEIDNSREARTELARELGAPDDVMGDSARMNTWLHKTVMRKIAENGGNIPRELMD
ncbi:MAG TPA: DUF3597 domain-containing protein [Anaerolineales bacterium]|nr:DUF3597 domain-containing protein [Anaerolineales bacterium]